MNQILGKLLKSGLPLLIVAACNAPSPEQDEGTDRNWPQGTYGYDLNFLKENEVEVLELVSEDSSRRIALAPAWQGRVLTSSSDGLAGAGNGWINYELISSQARDDQFNPFGGEERFWLGPEGGRFSLYFKKGDEQIFQNWRVPDFIDTHPFQTSSYDQTQAVFSGRAALTNASGNTLEVAVRRKVRLLSRREIRSNLGIESLEDLEYVAYESENTVANVGDQAWTRDYGFLSIWMLCMFNPSAEGIVIIPVEAENKPKEAFLTDDYFGRVPDDRLKLADGVVYFKVDGKLRSKIGISPAAAGSSAAGYDMADGKLTLVSYSGPDPSAPYVNSVWGDQDDPLEGDAVNAYNDGPVDGKIMGPFYEIETSSRAALLAPGDSLTHIQSVYHFKGSESSLGRIMSTSLNVTVEDVKGIFKK